MTQQILTLIRGLPGSGKSTLAKTLDATHLEADQFFINKQGEYRFDSSLLEQAHNWCLKQTELALLRKENVVVANTFVRYWEMRAYRKLAEKYQVKLEIITCKGEWANIHNVAPDVIQKMKKNWQDS
ncbi:ATP-binding protein [Catenovulum sp. 2E275]|uniref:ATP-binding protein n=1 Tax=Catenovulum sp. 2E275 TaxID=2980497 RepID=UPI0021CEF58F|nr:ATP-binding protein [Catenovulum sp. 2E275]MCU4675068.1 ATP-binding protein [Catenovulum sp. 2E275]